MCVQLGHLEIDLSRIPGHLCTEFRSVEVIDRPARVVRSGDNASRRQIGQSNPETVVARLARVLAASGQKRRACGCGGNPAAPDLSPVQVVYKAVGSARETTGHRQRGSAADRVPEQRDPSSTGP